LAAPIAMQLEAHLLRMQVDDSGQPWFNANDLCAALEFGNSRQAVETHVHADDVHRMDASVGVVFHHPTAMD
jgi:prophage antirepressor-like protein